jgi:tRNA(fMet)-specific endonuclease VapC
MSLARKPPHNVDREIEVYSRLVRHIANYRKTHVFPYDRGAAERLAHLESLKLRIGTNDLRIAAIVLMLDALLISRNLVDFTRIPNLRVEDWTRP